MFQNPHNPAQPEHFKGVAVPAPSFDELVAQARSAKLYEGPDGSCLPEVIKRRLTAFLKHALEQSGGVPQTYAVACIISPLPPGVVDGEPREFVEYDYDYDLGAQQTLHLENYRYLDPQQLIELDVVRRKGCPRDATGSGLSWPTEIVGLFRNIPGEDIGTYHTFQRIQVVLFESERERFGG